MGDARIRHELEFAIVAWSTSAPDPARAIVGRFLAYEDGRWALYLTDNEPLRGDVDHGGREAVTALMGWLLPTG